MTQAQMERELSRLTGESRQTLRQRGFSLVEMELPPPLTVDWDELDAQRVVLFPQPQRARRRKAA